MRELTSVLMSFSNLVRRLVIPSWISASFSTESFSSRSTFANRETPRFQAKKNRRVQDSTRKNRQCVCTAFNTRNSLTQEPTEMAAWNHRVTLICSACDVLDY